MQRFGSQHGNGSQTLLRSAGNHFYTTIPLISKTFSRIFIASMKSTLNSEYFEKKDQSHSLSITEIIDCETGSY